MQHIGSNIKEALLFQYSYLRLNASSETVLFPAALNAVQVSTCCLSLGQRLVHLVFRVPSPNHESWIASSLILVTIIPEREQ